MLQLSLSKVKTYESCHKKFHYTYVLKMPRKDADYFTTGKICHASLEKFHLAFMNGTDKSYSQVMTDVFKQVKEEYKSKSNPDMIKECFDILKEYLQIISTNKESTLSVPVIGVEKSFDIKLSDDIKIIGSIDRIQVDRDGVLHVADYKTTKNKKYLANDFTQLLTYAYALMNEDPTIEKIRASYVLLRHNFEPLTKEFPRPIVMEMKDKYLNYARQIINETEYKASPTNLCKWCEFIDICEDGRKFLKLENGEVNW